MWLVRPVKHMKLEGESPLSAALLRNTKLQGKHHLPEQVEMSLTNYHLLGSHRLLWV